MGSSDHETVWRSSLRRSSLHRIPTPNAEAVERVDDGQDNMRRVARSRLEGVPPPQKPAARARRRAADNSAIGEHLEIVVIPLAGRPRGRGAFEDQLGHARGSSCCDPSPVDNMDALMRQAPKAVAEAGRDSCKWPQFPLGRIASTQDGSQLPRPAPLR